MHRTSRLLFSLFVAVVAGWVVLNSAGWVLRAVGWQGAAMLLPTGWGARSGLFPFVVGLPVFLMAIAQLALDVRTLGRPVSPDATPTPEGDLPPEVVRRRSAVILGTIVGFAVAIWLIGFIVAVPLVTFLYLKVASGESWRLSIILSAIAGASFYLVFVEALGVPSPPGLLLEPFFG